MTTTTNPLQNIPQPIDAVHVSGWYDNNEPPTAPEPTVPKRGVERYFRAADWLVERDNRKTDMCLSVEGVQRHDGTTERYVLLDDDELTPRQAVRLAMVLLAAADACEHPQPPRAEDEELDAK